MSKFSSNSNLISIIIPVYNVEKYVSRCIESIINQTYKNIEIILVDDGSPDKSGEICKSYAQKDKRVKYFKKKNGGVSSARNYGLENSCGDLIMFVDSDDYAEPEMCEKLYNALTVNNSDFAMASNIDIHETHTYTAMVGDVKLFSQNEIVKFFNKNARNGVLYTVWNKLYKKQYITSLFDTSMTYGEDAVFNIKYLNNINSFVSIEDVLYNYNRINENSACHSFNDMRYEGVIKEYITAKNYVLSKGIPNKDTEPVHFKLLICMFSYSKAHVRQSKPKNFLLSAHKYYSNPYVIEAAKSISIKRGVVFKLKSLLIQFRCIWLLVMIYVLRDWIGKMYHKVF